MEFLGRALVIYTVPFARESEGETDHSSAQYLSRNVVLYTHYNGDVSDIVDQHFSKALNQSTYDEQKGKTLL